MTTESLPIALEVASLRTAVVAAQVAARLCQPALLVSTPNAAAQGGSLWFIEIGRQVEAKVPDADITMVLDCGDAAGYALEALHSGVHGVIFHGAPLYRDNLHQLAVQCGALFLSERPDCLYLDAEPDPLAACHAWFIFRGK